MLLFVGHQQLRGCGTLQWHNVRAKFRQNLSTGLKIKRRKTHVQTDW